MSQERFVGRDNPGSRARFKFGEAVKSMNPRKLQQLRALMSDLEMGEMLQEQDTDELGEYPKILYHEQFYAAQQAWKNATTPEAQRTEAAKMKTAQVKVWDLEDELEYTADGWKANPADFLAGPDHPELPQDPRIPTGREARLASRQKRESVEEEIARIRRRLTELTGTVEADPVQAAAPAVIRRKVVPGKRKKADEAGFAQ